MQLSFFDICSSWQSALRLKRRQPRRRLPRLISRHKPQIRLISECEQLTTLWHSVAETHFPDAKHLSSYTIGWSTRRQKRTLASCCIERQMVRVARELNYPELHCWLEPLIYHEMCHAVLGHTVPIRNRKRCWHGPEFKQLERRHPGIAQLDNWIKSGGWAKAVRSDRARRARSK